MDRHTYMDIVRRLDDPKAVMGTGESDGSDLTIINYDILDSWMPILKGIKFKTLIIDECHYIKNSKAQRTKAVRKLAKKIPHVIALSGTPITNRPIEFFNTLNIIKPEKFPAFWGYAMEYCAPKHNGWGWDFTGASNTKKLHEELVSSIMVRRRKDQVLQDLPEKVRTVIPMELDNRKEYYKAQNDFLSWLREEEGVEAAIKASRAQVLVQIERLKQLAAQGKIKGAVGWIKDFLDSDQKLVVFCVHKNIVDLLMKEFKGMVVKIDGSVPTDKRLQIVEQFQTDDKIRLFVGNIRAAGVGITLTAASNTCFLELGWTPGEHDQAEDRVHRIGQEASSVNAWYLRADGTVENDIAHLIDKKREVIANVLDGHDVDEKKILTELLYKMMEDGDE